MVQALLSESKSIYGNPWRADQWNITMQGQFVLRYGEAKAHEFAKAAGVKFGATRPNVPPEQGPYAGVPKSNFTVIVQRRGISAPVGGGGLVGAGSSGSGDP